MTLSLKCYKNNKISPENEDSQLHIDFTNRKISLLYDGQCIYLYNFEYDFSSKVAHLKTDVNRSTGEVSAYINDQVLGTVF